MPGSRRRFITLQRPVVTRDSFGSVISTWVDVDRVWAGLTEQRGKERFVPGAAVVVALRYATFDIAYRADVSELWRMIYDGKVWGILGIAEVGRRRSTQLICQSDGRSP